MMMRASTRPTSSPPAAVGGVERGEPRQELPRFVEHGVGRQGGPEKAEPVMVSTSHSAESCRAEIVTRPGPSAARRRPRHWRWRGAAGRHRRAPGPGRGARSTTTEKLRQAAVGGEIVLDHLGHGRRETDQRRCRPSPASGGTARPAGSRRPGGSAARSRQSRRPGDPAVPGSALATAGVERRELAGDGLQRLVDGGDEVGEEAALDQVDVLQLGQAASPKATCRASSRRWLPTSPVRRARIWPNLT